MLCEIPIKRMKWQPTEWEKTFPKDTSDQKQIFKICKEHIEVNNKERKILYDWKMSQRSQETPHQQDIKVENKHI